MTLVIAQIYIATVMPVTPQKSLQMYDDLEQGENYRMMHSNPVN